MFSLDKSHIGGIRNKLDFIWIHLALPRLQYILFTGSRLRKLCILKVIKRTIMYMYKADIMPQYDNKTTDCNLKMSKLSQLPCRRILFKVQ